MTYLKILVFSFFLLSGLFLYGQNAQKADTVSMICQTWKIKGLYHHNFKADEKEELDDFIKTTQMQFSKDGHFLTIADTVYIKGKWQLNGDIITVQMEDGDSFRMKIIALSSTAFNFESRPPDSEAISSAGILVPVREYARQ